MKKVGNPLSKNLSYVKRERCANPWNEECGNTRIALYIFYQDYRRPICRSCWNSIAEKDVEWGEGYAL